MSILADLVAFFFASDFQCLFRSNFYRFLNPTWCQLGFSNPPKSKKIDAKTLSLDDFIFLSMFHRFVLSTSTPRTFKIMFFPRENNVFSKNRLSKIRLIVVRFWRPTCPQDLPQIHQNRSKIYLVSRGINILIIFCFDFLSIWAPFWEPSWGHVGNQDNPNTTPGRPRTPLERRRKRRFYFKRPQEASQGSQILTGRSILEDSGRFL